jgi:CheY-like chemotaxis protein
MNSGKPVILVVEDEVLVRMMAVAIAEDGGFKALSAASADEAIGILESRSDVRLVFTDVNMPGSMNGLRLAHAVRGRWPPIELLVTSALGDITAKDLPRSGALSSQAL